MRTTTHGTVHRPAGLTSRRRHRRPPAVPVDIYRCEDHYLVLCDLPGLDPGSLDVHVNGTTITIFGHRSSPALHGATCVTDQRPVGRH